MTLVLVEKRNDAVRVVAHPDDVKVVVVDWDDLEGRPSDDVLSRAKQLLEELVSWSLADGKEDPIDVKTWDVQRRLQKLVQDCQFELKEPLEQLDELMRQHDWYYNMSDDHRVWVAGRAQWAQIEAYKEVVGEEAWRAKWQEHCPWAQSER